MCISDFHHQPQERCPCPFLSCCRKKNSPPHDRPLGVLVRTYWSWGRDGSMSRTDDLPGVVPPSLTGPHDQHGAPWFARSPRVSHHTDPPTRRRLLGPWSDAVCPAGVGRGRAGHTSSVPPSHVASATLTLPSFRYDLRTYMSTVYLRWQPHTSS